MSFGGAVAAMITSLKNNSRRHKRKSAFEGRGGETIRTRVLRFEKEHALTHEQLISLGKKTKKEAQIRQVKIWVVSILILLLLFFLGDLFWQYLNTPGHY
jgi:Flp pilus assembly protein TadB